jgi:hypothetical protein
VATAPLVCVRGDTAYRPIRRRVRFALEVACLGSEPHLEAAVAAAVSAATHDLAGQGFAYDVGLMSSSPLDAVSAAARNFLRLEAETGVRTYGDETEDTDAQILPHISRALDFTPDPGHVRPPRPVPGMSAEQRQNFRRVCDAVAAVERSRVAKDMPGTRDMVDVRMRLTFRERVPGGLVALPSSLRRSRA